MFLDSILTGKRFWWHYKDTLEITTYEIAIAYAKGYKSFA